jgi:hypothetical protein
VLRLTITTTPRPAGKPGDTDTMKAKPKTTSPARRHHAAREIPPPQPREPVRQAWSSRTIGRGAGRLLTNKEKAVLCQLARKAYDHLAALDLVDGMKFPDWRRAQQKAAVGKDSLTECTRDDWRPLAAGFYELMGWSHRAFLLWMHTGDTSDNAAPGDTHESREEIRALIVKALRDHAATVENPQTHGQLERSIAAKKAGGAIGWPYINAISIAKFRLPIDDLATAQLDQLLYTARNRIAAREGVGSTQTRNKRQRKVA